MSVKELLEIAVMYDEAQAENVTLMSKNDKLKAEIERMKEEIHWIPVSERLPKKGCYILVYCPKTQMVGEVFANDSIDFAHVYTHWKPIILPDQALKEQK